MHWVFIVAAILNVGTGLLYLRQRNKKYATLSFILAGVVLILGVVFRQ
ncbi:MAG: hypothetical protein PHD88_07710 [Firmicutes bacterium]|nr:hypothetical protein [Bacillota bacterium]MDD4694265.1 hypothetical protein [Bacillota bacterium]